MKYLFETYLLKVERKKTSNSIVFNPLFYPYYYNLNLLYGYVNFTLKTVTYIMPRTLCSYLLTTVQ